MSFLYGWLILLSLGIGIVLITRILQKFRLISKKEPFFQDCLYFFTILLVFLISGSLFCGFTAESNDPKDNPFRLGEINDQIFSFIQEDLAPEYYDDHPNATSTEFMFSSGQEWLKDAGAAPFEDLEGLIQHPYHLFLAIALFMMYPIFLKWGIRLGEMLFGSKEGKRGFISVLI